MRKMAEGSLEHILTAYEVPHINAPDKEGFAPLHCLLFGWKKTLTEEELLEQVRIMLAHGADPNTLTKLWTTPFQLACVRHSRAVARLLLDGGALLDGAALQTHSPFAMAVYYDRWDNAEWLVARGFNKHADWPELILLRERWRVRWFLVWLMRKRYRLPVEIVRCVMEWI